MSSTHPQHLTWAEALDRYLRHLLARNASPRTLDDRRREISHLSSRLHRTPCSVGLAELRAYQCSLLTGEGSASARPVAAATVAKVTTALRSFFAFLHDEGLLEVDPARRLERPRVPRRQVGEVLTQREVKRLLRAPSAEPLGLRDRALLELLYATGLRRAEACALDLLDLDHREREVRVSHGKGGRSRVVPLTRSAHYHVRQYLHFARPGLCSEHVDSQRALFLSAWGQRIKAAGLWRAVRAAGREAGLEKTLSPHVLRRTFATHLLRSGVSLRHIQVLLGHTNLNTTAIYLRLDREDLRREVLRRHPRERMEL